MRRIGFIGLGAMGNPMARNLLKAGYPLTVYDLVPARIQALVSAGARAASGPADVAVGSEVIITMLPNSPEVREVTVGAGGLVHHMKPGTVVIDMSTIEPRVVQEIAGILAQVGCLLLDAPVSRGVRGAEQGTLSIMVGGDRATFDDCQDVLRAMGTDLFYIGGSGMGQVAKLVNNTMAMVNVVVMAEAMVMGVKSGADPEVLFRVVTHSSGDSYALRDKLPHILSGRFQAGFTVDLAYKDLDLASRHGSHLRVPMAVTAVARELYGFARAEGDGDLDCRAVIRVLERAASAQVRSRG
ncbi:MAG: NAD(P)-dependent oxidoreductase [Candidatus Rokubacteria bacterium]|nr:NAD(P)-dependent oxidoreductase [Candidatus Rokubacteria bacterium]